MMSRLGERLRQYRELADLSQNSRWREIKYQ